MNTNAIDANKSLNQAIQTKGVTQNADVKVEPEAADKVQPVVQKLDSIELGTATSEDIGTYTVDRKKIDEIKQDFARNTESFKKMVEAMIEKQGKKVNQVLKGEMLHDAANEIERLQAIVRSNDPVVLLKEIWKHHQPVYLFEAIADTQKEKSHGLQ